MGQSPWDFFEMKKDLRVVQKAYDLCKEVLPRAANFPRDYKFALGDRIIDNCLSIHAVTAPE